MNCKIKLLVTLFSVCLVLSGCGTTKKKGGFSVAPPSSGSTASLKTGTTLLKPEPTSASAPQNPTEQSQPFEETPTPQNSTEPSQSAEETLTDNSSLVAVDSNVLEIGEKMFLAQIDDIYFNFDEYKDKTIVVEGMYTLFHSFDGEETVPAVYRRGPGCCGNDGWGGFLLKYDGEPLNENDWVRVTGTPELVVEKYYINLFLNVSNIEVKTERGAEFVTQ